MTVSDLAEQVAIEFEAEVCEPLARSELPTVEELKKGLLTRLSFSWTREDRQILDRIRAASNAMFAEMFGPACEVIDALYARMRVPLGVGPDGRMQWQRDEQGRIIEDVSQLTGQDIRQAIMGLQKVLLDVTPQVSELMLEAIMAHNIARDSFDEGWFQIIDGTQGDRTAKANQASRQDRWHAFFRLYLYEIANSFLKELRAVIRRLENIDYRQTRDCQ